MAREGVAGRLSREADRSAERRWADGRDVAAKQMLVAGDEYERMASDRAGTPDRRTAADFRVWAAECRHAAAVLSVDGWGAAFALWPYRPAGGK